MLLDAGSTGRHTPGPPARAVRMGPGGGPDDRRAVLAPPALRLHHHVPLPVSAADDGAGASSSSSSSGGPSAPASALHADAARFWARIFGVNFALGVVTGIPMEFQFGTNWARFCQFAGGVIGQTLAMEGVFAFFLESTFLGLFLYGEKRLRSAPAPRLGHRALGGQLALRLLHHRHQRLHAASGGAHRRRRTARLQLADFWAFVLNPWAVWQYLHNMTASVVTASFVVAGVGAFWTLSGRAPGPRAPRLAHRGHRRAGRLLPDGLPDRRPSRKAARREAARHARRDGGAVREQARRRAGDHRPAGRRATDASRTRWWSPGC